jgi:hypothetical protein
MHGSMGHTRPVITICRSNGGTTKLLGSRSPTGFFDLVVACSTGPERHWRRVEPENSWLELWRPVSDASFTCVQCSATAHSLSSPASRSQTRSLSAIRYFCFNNKKKAWQISGIYFTFSTDHPPLDFLHCTAPSLGTYGSRRRCLGSFIN